MNYEELLTYLEERLGAQTASRLTEAIWDAGGIDAVKSLLNDIEDV